MWVVGYRAGMTRMRPADARTYWMSAAIPSDQFLLFCFALGDRTLPAIAADLARRAAQIPDLNLRVLDVPGTLDYPLWVAAPVRDEQIVVHPDVGSWRSALVVLGELMADQLDASDHTWRLHLIGPVDETPRGSGVVAVVQIAHALGDGRRVSAIARDLFTESTTSTVVTSGEGIGHDPGQGSAERLASAARGAAMLPIRLTRMLLLGGAAFRSARRHRGGATSDFPVTVLNRPPGDDRALAVLVLDRAELPTAWTVTVSALTAISVALSRHLGAGVEPLGVELTIGRVPRDLARNDFGNAGIDLHVEIDDLDARAAAIAAEIAWARDADAAPARRAQRRADNAVPAILAHWGAKQFDPTRPPQRMTGVTVVSSVHRGAADLTLAGQPVLFTAGFPALSPAQGLTHGVHGIGDTVAISVTSSHSIMPDVEAYLRLLADAVALIARGGPGQESADSSPPRE